MKKLLRKLTAVVSAAAVAIAGVNFGGIGGLNLTARAETPGTLDISAGSIVITATGYTVGGGAETAYMGDYTITGSTETNTITVKKDVSANITLSGVTIDVSKTSGACAFKIEDNSKGDVTITLADDSVNTLSSGDKCAGLQKNGDGADIGKLTIQGGTNGTGKLISKGNVNFGAGIGGGEKGSTSNIKITGGTVTASGSYGGAGIGGGYGGSASDIEITGGKVIATGGSKGAGIGGGDYRGNGSKITISGGIVTANGNYGGAGIGGGDYYGNGTDITITGGVVTANGSHSSDDGDSKGIGSGGGLYHGSTSNIIITGGSVYTSSIGVTPTLADGTTRVYPYNIDTNSVASSITIDGVAYPTSHNGEAKIYPYLTDGFHTIVKDGSTTEVIYMGNNGNVTSLSPVTVGAFVVYGETSAYSYSETNKVLTVSGENPLMIKNASTGSTTDRIEVADGVSANITLAGVDIALSGLFNAALKISDESTGDVTITLVGGSVNKLKSSNYCAGLQKNGGADSGTLTITGTGTLIAEGGAFAAGIGGGYNGNGFNITIKNGVVSATGGQGAAGIGGGKPVMSGTAGTGEAGNIIISGGSVNATGYNRIGGGNGKEAVTPTNGSENVYLLEIANADGAAITINGTAYPTSHNGEQKIYPYLPAKTAQDPNIVTVGTTTTKYYYDEDNSKWITIVDIPNKDTRTFTYTGYEQTYTIAESEDYTVSGNKQTDAGEYTVTVTLKDNAVWSDGTTTDKEYTFKIGKAPATAPAVPTASAAVEYGKTLADAGLTEGWLWESENTVPTVASPANTYTAYKELTDDDNYDYSGLRVSGFTYNETEHTLSYEVPVTVNSVTPVITITAVPDSAITGMATTVTVTVTAKNPNNDTLTDVPTPAISYKIGTSGTETSIQNGSFVIPDDTPNGTVVTITAKTAGSAQYNSKTETKTITVADCTHSSLTFVDELPATCTVDGYEAHFECNVCGKLFTDENGQIETTLAAITIPAAHTLTKTPVKSATCTEDGNIDYWTCDICGKYFSDANGTTEITRAQTVIEKTGHNLTKTPAKSATCTADGNIEYWTCSSCGKFFSDANGTTEITRAQTVIEKTGHNLTKTPAKSATCTADGNIEYWTCSRCGKYFSDANGTTEITRAQTVVEKTAHTLTKTPAKSATCTEDGNIEYWTCSSCGKYFSNANGTTEITRAQTVIEKTGHTLTKTPAKSATCTADGNIEYWTCSRCGKYFSDANGTTEITQAQTVIEKTGHTHSDPVKENEAAATCTVDGSYDEVVYCTVCKAEISRTPKTITATGHKWLEAFESDADGHWHKCKVCESTTDKEAHTPGEPATLDHAQLCTVCGYEIAPKLGQVAAPTFSPNGGTFSGSKTVTITCATEGAAIYYTTDGTEPTKESMFYEGALTLTATTTVKAIAIKDGMVDSEIATAAFTKKSSGGGGGGGHRPTPPNEPKNPSIGGSAKSWSDIAADLGKLTNGSETTIELNGNSTVPVEVIKVIAEKKIKATFVVDSVKSWKADGAEITTPAAADLSILTTSKLKTDALRGISGLQFTMNNTNIPTDLTVAFKPEHAGKFANLYKSENGKLMFVTCAKLGEDGKVILPDVIEKGDYVAMLCEFSDRLGDMDNDGVMNAKDASAILKDIVGLEPGKNPLMADFNGDGKMNAMDASAILKRIVGLA